MPAVARIGANVPGPAASPLFWSLLLLVLLAACGSGEKQEAPPPPQVTVATPLVREMVDWDDYVGRFESVDRVEVKPRVSGYLQASHFRDGDYVRQGALLFTIDARPAQAALDQARAQLSRAEATLANARTALAPLEAELERMRMDAERYRWLRDKADYLRVPEGSPQVCLTDEWGEIVSVQAAAYPRGSREQQRSASLAASRGALSRSSQSSGTASVR